MDNSFTIRNDDMFRCQGVLHIVKKGDTLYKIAKKYGVPLSRVMYANPYVDVYNLQPGDEICVPVMMPRQPVRQIQREIPRQSARQVQREMTEQPARQVQREMAEQPARQIQREMTEQPARQVQREMAEQPARQVQREMTDQPARQVQRERMDQQGAFYQPTGCRPEGSLIMPREGDGSVNNRMLTQEEPPVEETMVLAEPDE